MDIKIIEKQDECYPEKLKQILNAPDKLYVAGNEKLLNNKSIAIVGSRCASEYGIKYAKKFAREISKEGVTIVSGLASGIDSIAHEFSQSEKGKTIAVIGCGMNHVYPEENRGLFNSIINNGGCIVSEYEPDDEVNMKNFPKRNRIISGISDGVLVIEAAYKSGSTITGNLGLKQGKKVFCIPRNLEETKGKGTNNLIKKGAKLVTSVEDIFNEYEGWNIINKSNLDLKIEKTCEINKSVPKEYMYIYQLISYTPQNIQYFVVKSGMKIAEVTQKLIMLELKGYIKSMPR